MPHRLLALARMPSSIRSRLLGLVAVILLPAVTLSSYLAYRFAASERHTIEAQRTDAASSLSSLLDSEVKLIEGRLGLLALSFEEQAGDLTTFRKLATKAISGNVAGFALLEESGQQVISTFVEPGEPLPKRDDMSMFKPLFAGSGLLVSEVLEGTAAKRPIVSVAVPVKLRGQVVYVLSAVVYPERLAPLFAGAGINSEWAAAVVDRHGLFVTRNINPQQFVGKQARPELLKAATDEPETGTFENVTYEGVHTGNSFRRSPLTGWTSVVSVPVTVLYAASSRATRWVTITAIALLILSSMIASFLASQISGSILSFSDAATALLSGQPLPNTQHQILELEEVRTALELTAGAIAERKKADDHVRFLLQELTHRSKNLISVIQAVATSTSKASNSLADFQQSFAQRLSGLAVSNDLLIREKWTGVSLRELVQQQLGPFIDKSSARVAVDCPDVTLTGQAAQAVGLALHELATNATKYGALSGPTGQITVAAVVTAIEMADWLRISWVESGGPKVVAPTRTGFGTVVIDRMVASTVGGKAELSYPATGVKWSLLIGPSFFTVAANTQPDAVSSTARHPSSTIINLASESV